MRQLKDNELVRDVIEMFVIQYFDDINMSGSVRSEKHNDINYFSIDLVEKQTEGLVEKLDTALRKYLIDWARINSSSVQNIAAISTLTVEYLLPKKDGSVQNQSRIIRLFYLPSYYFQGDPSKGRPRRKVTRFIIKFWRNVVIRNLVLIILLVFAAIIATLINLPNRELEKRLSDSFSFVNTAASIIASLALSYLISKALTIRQEKLKRVDEIKQLSNKLTYFRNICYNFLWDHNYWNKQHPHYESFKHGESLKNVITYEDYYYPDYENNVEFARIRAAQDNKFSNAIVTLVLQLHMMADDKFLHSGLTFTKYPPDYIYSMSDMEKFYLFADNNTIWYCCDEMDVFPAQFPTTYAAKEILNDMARIDDTYKAEILTKKAFSDMSLIFQYEIIPRLYRLIKLNTASLPPTVTYFRISLTLLLTSGIILPSLARIVEPTAVYSSLSVYIIIGIISHILLSLNAILRAESTLLNKDDYI